MRQVHKFRQLVEKIKGKTSCFSSTYFGLYAREFHFRFIFFLTRLTSQQLDPAARTKNYFYVTVSFPNNNMEAIAEDICPLCGRAIANPCNKHHLLPKSKGGKNTPTILLHKICHDKIHAVLTETELKRHYSTIESLQQQEEIAKFIKWVNNKEPEFYDKSVKSKSRSKSRKMK